MNEFNLNIRDLPKASFLSPSISNSLFEYPIIYVYYIIDEHLYEALLMTPIQSSPDLPVFNTTYRPSSEPKKQFATAWSGEGKVRKVLLISEDLEFIHKCFELLSEYTKRIDPHAALAPCRVEPFKGSLQFLYDCRVKGEKFCLPNEQRYFCTEINDILPRTMKIFYGYTIYANCHGAALLASGVLPVLAEAQSSIYGPWSDNMIEIPAEARAAGDLVVLLDRGHSFVYLDDQLCLSMNGRGRSLELHQTAEVLKTYDYPEDALTSKDLPKKICFRRRKNQYNHLEEIMPALLDYYSYHYARTQHIIGRENIFDEKMVRLENEFSQFLLAAQGDKSIPFSTKKVFKHLYRIVRGQMPAGLINKPYTSLDGTEKPYVETPTTMVEEAHLRIKPLLLGGLLSGIVYFYYLRFLNSPTCPALV